MRASKKGKNKMFNKLFGKKRYRVRSWIKLPNGNLSTHSVEWFKTEEEAQREHDALCWQWEDYIKKGTFQVEDVWYYEK